MNPKYLYSVSDNRSGELYISKHQRSPNNVKSHSSFYLLNLGISFPQTTNNIITMATYDSKGIYAAVMFWKALHKDFSFPSNIENEALYHSKCQNNNRRCLSNSKFFGKFLDGGATFLLLPTRSNKSRKVPYAKWRSLREKMNQFRVLFCKCR